MPQVNQNQATTQSEHPEDQINSLNTLYSVTGFEIIWRNLLAGMSRALGNLIVYFIVLGIVVNLFLTYAYPHIKPFIDEYRQVIRLFTQTQNPQDQTGTTANLPQVNFDPEQLKSIMADPNFQEIINNQQQK
jgi:hypothetical protein